MTPATPPSIAGPEPPLAAHIADILTCVHCGFCLPACPTYQVLGDENDSPRGRLYLMLAVAEGRLEATDPAFARHIDQCLGCRACEPVCPSGVRYGFLLEKAREARAGAGGALDRLARLGLNIIFTRPRLQRLVWFCARILRATRLPGLIARAGPPGVRPSRLRFAMAMLAASDPRAPRAPRPAASPKLNGRGKSATARASGDSGTDGENRELVALLAGCVMSGLLDHVNRATETVVRAGGAQTVSLPPGLCCGALHAHAGELASGRRLARRLIDRYENSGAGALLTNSAGCGAALKEYADWLSDDPAYAGRARRFSESVRDVSEWLLDRSRPEVRPIEARVAYDAACHLLHAQGIADAPIELLAEVPGVEVKPLPCSERCCGAAGTYGLTQRRLSHELLQRKLEEIRESGARWVVTANPGCMIHIGAGALIERLPVQVIHPVELLAAALPARSLPNKSAHVDSRS